MADLRDGLITGRGKKQAAQMRKRFEECELKVKALRNKNNELQKQCDNDLLDGDIKAAIKSQTHFIDSEIKSLKTSLEQLSKDYTDNVSKQKMKQICSIASKEMQRNKRIMEQFINRVSGSPSVQRRSSTHPFNKSRSEMDRNFVPKTEDQSMVAIKEVNEIYVSQQLASDMKAEQKMLAERNALLKQLQAKNQRINQIMNEMGEMVGGEQKDLIDAMDDNLISNKQNLQDVNSEMQQAIVYQKKSKKKYICIISIVVVVLLIAVGLIYFLVLDK